DFEVLILYTKGNYVIIDGRGDWKEKFGFGTKITAVNDKPIDNAILDTYEKAFLYYDTKRDKPYQLFIDPKLFSAQAIFTLETIDGQIKKVTFESKLDYNYRQVFKYPTEWMTTKLWPGKKIAYIRFSNFELGNFNDETKEYLLAFYKQIKDYDQLIIDVRGNSGGWKEVWISNIIAPLIKKKITAKMFLGYLSGDYVNLFRKTSKIEKIEQPKNLDQFPPEIVTQNYTIYDNSITVEPLNAFDFNAQISILIDNMTWSAATAFALFSQETGFAKLYGTPTKGEGISDGTIFYVLPNSKIFVRFNPSMGITETGKSCEEDKLQPDVYHESELRNHNELVEFVLNDLGEK
ncbi:MAG: S41 family peptidase, partial [Candidatus Heimdallarchaeota archaeon]